jgi:ligand-binding sensor domain-containing protein
MGPVVINSRIGDIKRLPYGLYSEDVSALIKLNNALWVGSASGGADDTEPGITAFDTSLQNWQWFVPRIVFGLEAADISSAVGDPKAVWLGTSIGVEYYNKEDNRFITFSEFTPLPSIVITSLAEDSACIYVGTEFGLGYIAKDQQFKNHKNKESASDSSQRAESGKKLPLSGKNYLKGFYINALKEINNYLYVASDRGVLRRPMNSYGDFEYINTPERMLSDDILDIAKSGDSLLFATKYDIIIVDTKSGASSSLTNLAHFGQWNIRKIQVDSLNIWAATNAGLWKYRLRDGYERLFTSNDGMISSDIRSLEIIGDYIWMATPKGAIRFLWNRHDRVD